MSGPAPAAAAVAPRVSAEAAAAPSTLAELAAVQAVAWLVAGCAAGLWMATLVVAPELGGPGALTYGRWAALHLDLTLYGWLALPLVSLLIGAYGLERHVGLARLGRLALALWSGALVAGAASWLGGRSSGKLFLDWEGGARALFLGAQACLAIALAAGLMAELGRRRAAAAPFGSWLAGRASLLLVLAGVPVAFVVATGTASYPPIDTASGGPTGNSLLGSSLALVAVLLLVPRLAGLPRSAARRGWREMAARGVPSVLFLHGAIFAWLGHGDRTNDDAVEVAALASVAIWAALLPLDAACFEWPETVRRALGAAAVWGALLLASGLVQFLPVPLERLKFTHGLVAHAHLAMAGFSSAIGIAILELRFAGGTRAGALTSGPGFALWQAGTALHVAALAALGALEAADPAAVLRGGTQIDLLFGARWFAGALMLVAAVRWLAALGRAR